MCVFRFFCSFSSHIRKNRQALKPHPPLTRSPTVQEDVHEDIESFRELKVKEMLDDLEATHHVTDRRLMAETEELLNKILIVHYPHHGELLTRLHHLYSGLKAELEEHFAKEERLVFPLMREHPHPEQAVLDEVRALEAEHSGAGDVIKEIYQLTDHFTLPEDACPTFQRTYQVMEALFEDVFIHIFKENSIVFPEYAEQL
jgi:regulator of cell morphogenesis and NO signaling